MRIMSQDFVTLPGVADLATVSLVKQFIDECGDPDDEALWTHVWRWKSRLPERKGERCRVLARGKRNSCLVEFRSDGYKVVTSRWAVRKWRP